MTKKGAKILIIIPAYNESENITAIIHEISSTYPDYHILVVNDGSTDSTGRIAKFTGKARVVNLAFNLGIGAAVQTGFKYAKKNGYDIAMQFDGDGQHMVPEIKKIVEPLIRGEADCMVGSRFIQEFKSYKTTPLRRLGIWIFEYASWLLIGQKIKDQTSGFRAYNKEIIAFLCKYYPTDYPEPEIIVLLGKNGFRIREVFTQMRERQGGISSISTSNGVFYMIKVLLAMFMAALREKRIKQKRK